MGTGAIDWFLQKVIKLIIKIIPVIDISNVFPGAATVQAALEFMTPGQQIWITKYSFRKYHIVLHHIFYHSRYQQTVSSDCNQLSTMVPSQPTLNWLILLFVETFIGIDLNLVAEKY